MAGEWSMDSLENLIDVKHGFAFAGEHIHEEPRGDVLLTPGNFAIGGGFKSDKFKYYDGPVPDEYVLDEGDLIVTMTDLSKQSDTLGFPAFVPASRDGRRFLHNQRLGKVVLRNPKSLDTRYLYYIMCGQEYRHEVLASATGTTVKHTSPNRIRRFRFACAPHREQRAIAHILGTLDDKIELNRRMIETLEAMARALFKSWFVEFDPVRAKAEGRDPGLPRHIADQFPDGFDDSETGEIPAGWRIVGFGDLVDIVLGGTPRTSVGQYWNGPIAWAAAKDVTKSPAPFILKTERSITQLGLDQSNAKLLPELTTIVTARGTVGIVRMLGRPMAINQTSYALLPKADVAPALVYFLLGSLLEQLKQRSYGTVFDTITTRTLASLACVSPPRDLTKEFERQVGSLLKRLLSLSRELERLAELRDTVLPKLISGELRVRRPRMHAERVV